MARDRGASFTSAAGAPLRRGQGTAAERAAAARRLLPSRAVRRLAPAPVRLARAALVAFALALPGGPASAQTWRTVPSGASRAELGAVAFDPTSGRVFVGDARGVFAGDARGAFARVLDRGPVRDLALAPGADPLLWVATDEGLFRIGPDGARGPIAPRPGEAARASARVAAVRSAVAVATADGAFVSRDGRRWQRLSAALPLGSAGALALREGESALECWVAVGRELWRARLRARDGGFEVLEAEATDVPAAVGEAGAVDLALDLPDVEVAALYPGALAVRLPGAGRWRVLRPPLPAGARATRLVAALGRVWIATDAGLLEAPGVEGPWRRSDPPAGAADARALAGGPGALYAATGAGLLAASASGGATPPAPAREERARSRAEPSIQEVHRAALAYLALGRARLERLRSGVGRRGWLPLVALRLSRDGDVGARTEYDQSVSSGTVHDLVDRDRDASHTWEVALTLSWDLGDVLYHPEQVDVSRETRELIRLRDTVLDQLNQLFFDRRSVLAELGAQPEPQSAAARALRLRADALAAGIDAWTGGWFTSRAPPLVP